MTDRPASDTSTRRRRQQLEATLRTGNRNAAAYDAAGMQAAAARLRARLVHVEAELNELSVAS